MDGLGLLGKRGAALRTVALGGFMVQMALSPVSAILPTIADSWAIDVNVASWMMTSYLLLLTGFLLTSGRLGDQFGHGRVYILGAAIYGGGALLAALSGDVTQLIAFRGLQGIGSALMLGNGLAILGRSYPLGQQGRVIGIATMASSAGGFAGIALASVFVQYLSWRWMFGILMPLGILAVWSGRGMEIERPVTPRARIDLPGAILLFLTLTALSLSLSHLHGGAATFSAGWEYHGAMELLTITLAVLFLMVEGRARDPLLAIANLRHWAFSSAIGANAILHMTMMGTMFLLPFMLEKGLGMPTAYTATVLAASNGAAVLAGLVSGWLYDRTRSPLIAPLSMGGVASGLALLGLAGPRLSPGALIGTAAYLGVGMGLFMTANNTTVMTALAPGLRGFSSGLLETTRQLGHSLAVPITTAVIPVGTSVIGQPAFSPSSYLQAFQTSCLLMTGFAVLGILTSLSRRPWAHPQPAPATEPELVA